MTGRPDSDAEAVADEETSTSDVVVDEEDLDGADSQEEPLSIAPGDRKLVTQPYDLGVRSIKDDIAEGRISLTIEYQRRYVWDNGKASRLIESLLLNVPIPVCYFAEDDDGVYEVIDGLQRLTAIERFLTGKFALTGLSVLPELIGKKIDNLSPRDRRRLEGRAIRCIVITADSHPDIKFDVFERLNTGAVRLTAQELRNSVYRGPFNEGLKRLAKEEYFTSLAGTQGNKRMSNEELALRFFALTDGVGDYKPPLRQFLNTYMRANRKISIDAVKERRFRDCCEAVHAVFGPRAFGVPGATNPVNKALYDAVMVAVAFCDRDKLYELHDEAQAALATLLNEERFQTAIGRATADRSRMNYRIGALARELEKVGVASSLPRPLIEEE